MNISAVTKKLHLAPENFSNSWFGIVNLIKVKNSIAVIYVDI